MIAEPQSPSTVHLPHRATAAKSNAVNMDREFTWTPEPADQFEVAVVIDDGSRTDEASMTLTASPPRRSELYKVYFGSKHVALSCHCCPTFALQPPLVQDEVW